MKHAETVTFGGSGLDRAAHLRGDAGQIAALLAAGRVLPVWRGKPLIAGDGAPGWLAADHPVVQGAGPALFLGRDEQGRGLFACDLSGWQPPEGTDLPEPGFFDRTVQHHPDLPPDWGFAELRGVMTRLDARGAELAATARALLMWHHSHGFCARCGARSEMAQAGWQRNCPVCGAQHFPRTDPVVIMLVTRGNRVLLGRSAGWPEGMYSCLAGFVEPGETIEAAVRREVQEEAGVAVGPVRYLASQPWPFPASLMIGCAAEAVSDTITIDPAELEHALWVSRERVLASMDGSDPALRPARHGSIAHFLLTNWLADRLD